MAFGFFKKSETADTIFMGGEIFTQNADFPWAEAVACKDGQILAVGDYEDVAEFEGKNTETIDLKGGFMLPGYIDTCGHPVMKAFKDSCLFLESGDLEETLSQISEYAAENQNIDIIFGYGYNENILQGIEAERTRAMLDEVCGDKPAIILGKSGFHCLVNTAAMEIVKAAAEEDEIKTITLSYLLGILEPINLETFPEALPDIIGGYCKRGFTAVFDCGAPDFFASAYQNIMIHLYQEEMLKHRYYGALQITRDINPKAVIYRLSQLRTNCAELNGYLDFKAIKLIVNGNDDELSISEEILGELCLEACDKGFDVHIDALGQDAVEAAVAAMSTARSAGYKKNALSLACDQAGGSEQLSETCCHFDINESVLTYGILDSDWLCIENAESVEDAIDMLTINAAIQLGISNEYGSIEKGKHADFVIFNENPFDAKTLSEFKKLQASLVVIDGAIVYDAEEDDMSQ